MSNELNEKEDLINIHNARKGIYTFCDKGFLLTPEDELFNILQNDLPQLKNLAVNSENSNIIDGLNGIELFFKQRDALDDADRAEYDLEALRKYTTLFCLANSVPTVESYYTSPERLVMQESRDKMLALLRKHKLKRSDNVREFDDHISVELAFMATMADESIKALQADNKERYNELLQEQIDFHINHFDKWIPAFIARILAHKVPDELICKSIAKFTYGFIQEDKLVLEELKYS